MIPLPRETGASFYKSKKNLKIKCRLEMNSSQLFSCLHPCKCDRVDDTGNDENNTEDDEYDVVVEEY